MIHTTEPISAFTREKHRESFTLKPGEHKTVQARIEENQG